MGTKVRLLVGSDSAGFDYKDAILADMKSDDRVESVEDLGVYAGKLEDGSYPSVAIAAGTKISAGEADRAILVCGTGHRGRHRRQQGPRHPRDGRARLLQRRALDPVQRLPGAHPRPAGDRSATGSAAGQGVAGLRLRPEQPVQRQGRGDHRVRGHHHRLTTQSEKPGPPMTAPSVGRLLPAANDRRVPPTAGSLISFGTGRPSCRRSDADGLGQAWSAPARRDRSPGGNRPGPPPGRFRPASRRPRDDRRTGTRSAAPARPGRG